MIVERDMTGFRLAKGNKFATILDSYLYALALVGERCDEYSEHESGYWVALLASDDFVADLGVLAKRCGLRIDHLELTAEEVIELNTTSGLVVIETPEGLVEVNYYFSFDEAYALFYDLYADGITVSKETTARLNKKPQKKKRLTQKQVDAIVVRVDKELAERRKALKEIPEIRHPLERDHHTIKTIPRGIDLNENLFDDAFPRSNYD